MVNRERESISHITQGRLDIDAGVLHALLTTVLFGASTPLAVLLLNEQPGQWFGVAFALMPGGSCYISWKNTNICTSMKSYCIPTRTMSINAHRKQNQALHVKAV